MKHVKALVVKAIMIWAILWVVLTGLYGVSFMDSTIVGVIHRSDDLCARGSIDLT